MRIQPLLLFVLILSNVFQDSQPKRTPNKPKRPVLPGRINIRFDYLRDCANVSTLVARILRSHMRSSNTEIVMDVDYFMSRRVERITKGIIFIYNCEDRASPNCPLFQSWRFGKESCAMIAKKNQLWSPIFDNIHPRLICPHLPGKRELRNGSLDIEVLKTLPFPLERFYWRLRLEAYEPLLYFCNEGAAQILRSFA